MQIKTQYDVGEKVVIDGDGSLVGTISAVCLRGMGLNVTYEVSYIHCGSSCSPWIEEWRLTPWQG